MDQTVENLKTATALSALEQGHGPNFSPTSRLPCDHVRVIKERLASINKALPKTWTSQRYSLLEEKNALEWVLTLARKSRQKEYDQSNLINRDGGGI